MNNSFFRSIEQFDKKIIAWIEKRLYKPWLTSVMAFFSHPPYWQHLLVVIIIITLIFGSNQIRWQLGILILAIFLSEHTCNLIKSLVKRVRPDGVRSANTFWEKLGRYSFPSSHAANNFCVAVLTFHYWPYIGIFFYFWATLVAFSRIYLKNHYFSDVIGGGLVGVIYALLFIQMKV